MTPLPAAASAPHDLRLHELRRLHHSLADAPDSLLAKVVAVVDALDNRGAADAVIAPLRPRLAQLRPRRPLRFCRLLFMPLDPLIVPVRDCAGDGPTLPRSALLPIAAAVRSAMPAQATAIDAMIAGHTVNEDAVAAAAGRILWPAAAQVLAALPRPDLLTGRVATLLGMTARLLGLFAAVEAGVAMDRDTVLALLADAAARDDQTLTMLLVLLLARLPEDRKSLLDMAEALGARPSEAVCVALGQAQAVLLDRLDLRGGIETLVIGAGLGQAGSEVRRIIALLDGIEEDETPRVHGILQRLDASCRLRFATALEAEFTTALHAPQGDGNDGRSAAIGLEDVARGLHDLELEARRIGSAAMYDRLLQQAATMVQDLGPSHPLGPIDRVRLVEILAGPDAALEMLDRTEAAS
ncbi:MAG: hypothetical protein WDN25_24460 [Acetobacteraceae bacterium]